MYLLKQSKSKGIKSGQIGQNSVIFDIRRNDCALGTDRLAPLIASVLYAIANSPHGILWIWPPRTQSIAFNRASIFCEQLFTTLDSIRARRLQSIDRHVTYEKKYFFKCLRRVCQIKPWSCPSSSTSRRAGALSAAAVTRIRSEMWHSAALAERTQCSGAAAIGI